VPAAIVSRCAGAERGACPIRGASIASTPGEDVSVTVADHSGGGR